MRQDLRLMCAAGAALGGAAVGLHVPAPVWFAILVLLSVVVVAIVSIRGVSALAVWVLVGCGAWASTVLFHGLTHPAYVPNGHFAVVQGTVIGRVEPWGTDNCLVRIAPEHIEAGHAKFPVARLLRIGVISRDTCDVIAGQRVEATGALQEPPFESREVAHLRARSTRVWGEGNRAARSAAEIRRALVEVLADRPAHARGLIPGVALGDDSQVTSELEDAMTVTQLSHLTAVSGGHVSLLMGGAIAVVGRKNALRAGLLGGGVLGGLIVLVGWEASVIRAAGMAAVVLMALVMGRATQAIPALSATIVGVVLIDPWIATSYGFLLSSSATAGIAIWGNDLRRRLSESLPGYAADAIAIPIVAQIACVPVLWTFADAGSVWGVLANVVTAPVVAPLTLGGVMGALLAPSLPGLAQVAIFPAQMATWWIDRVAITLASWPGSDIEFSWAAGALIVLGLLARFQKLRLIGVVAVVGICVSLVHREETFPADWEAIQCDVGQGSAFLIRHDDQTVVIDVGPPGGAASACLRAAGVTRVDLAVLSHFHSDHVGGLSSLTDAVEIDQLWVSPNAEPEENSAWVRQVAARHEIPVREVTSGEQYGEWLDVIWPRNGYSGDANNSSVVVRADVAGGILVLGDVEEQAQRLIASKLDRVYALVMAHHGSADQDPRLASTANPELVFVSVGENSYGHPSKRALELYDFAEILPTSRCGSIAIDEERKIHSRCS